MYADIYRVETVMQSDSLGITGANLFEEHLLYISSIQLELSISRNTISLLQEHILVVSNHQVIDDKRGNSDTVSL